MKANSEEINQNFKAKQDRKGIMKGKEMSSQDRFWPCTYVIGSRDSIYIMSLNSLKDLRKATPSHFSRQFTGA